MKSVTRKRYFFLVTTRNAERTYFNVKQKTSKLVEVTNFDVY